MASRDIGRNHYWSARDMLDTAAAWGSKTAQYLLGLMYFNGDHVPANRPLGLAWLALAAERGAPEPSAVELSAVGKVSPAERRQAQQLFDRMRLKYGDAVAAARAKRRYDRAYYELTRDEAYGVQVCINGLTPLAQFNPGMPLEQQPSCPPVMVVAKKLDGLAGGFFDDWQGVVHVGRLISVPGPKPSSSTPATSPRQP